MVLALDAGLAAEEGGGGSGLDPDAGLAVSSLQLLIPFAYLCSGG